MVFSRQIWGLRPVAKHVVAAAYSDGSAFYGGPAKREKVILNLREPRGCISPLEACDINCFVH